MGGERSCPQEEPTFTRVRRGKHSVVKNWGNLLIVDHEFQ